MAYTPKTPKHTVWTGHTAAFKTFFCKQLPQETLGKQTRFLQILL